MRVVFDEHQQCNRSPSNLRYSHQPRPASVSPVLLVCTCNVTRRPFVVTFPKEGDQGPNNIPADVVFVIRYKDHPRFKRKGNDLIHVTRVKLADALCGCSISLLTLGAGQCGEQRGRERGGGH